MWCNVCRVALAGALVGAADGDGMEQNLARRGLQVKTTEVLATQLMNIKLAQLEVPQSWQINCLKSELLHGNEHNEAIISPLIFKIVAAAAAAAADKEVNFPSLRKKQPIEILHTRRCNHLALFFIHDFCLKVLLYHRNRSDWSDLSLVLFLSPSQWPKQAIF